MNGATRDVYEFTVALMGTVVTIQVVGHGADDAERAEREEGVKRAVAWFHRINECCSRFDPGSELSRLSARTGERVAVSPMLFEAVRFAMSVAEESGGAFDPTVGHRMESRGFNQEFRTGNTVRTAIPPGRAATFRDVCVDTATGTITLLAPMVLDLGAVAKGLAVDMAARELAVFGNFAIDAGGDLYLGGCNQDGLPWTVGIRHPRDDRKLIETLRVSNGAVCTSGDYERKSPLKDGGHHIMDPRTGASAGLLASVTVRAPSAMVADALATAAFVLGPHEGLAFLEGHGVEGLMLTPSLERFATPGMMGD